MSMRGSVDLGWLRLAAIAATATLLGAVSSQAVGSANTLCVGVGVGCLTTLQGALEAADDGDTITLGEGTFAGGIRIDKSVSLVGAGADRTIIEGGGPVIAIGTPDPSSPPTLSIRRVTISGGLNDSHPRLSVAMAGGVWVAPAEGDTTGASVTISDSIITGNRAAPRTADPSCGYPCAAALGGGIYNAGTLSLTDTWVSDNVAGSSEADDSVADYAAGGGIFNGPQGTLTLLHSFVTGNRAAVNRPNGRNTDGGGIVSYGQLTVERSVISGNRSEVEASVPSVFFEDGVQEANAGGLYLPSGSSTTISRSLVSGNKVISSNTGGDASAESGGIDSEGSLLLIDSAVVDNLASASVPASSSFLVETDAGGIQVNAGGTTTIRDSLILGNRLEATSQTGPVYPGGGGIANLSSSLTLERTVVAENSVRATGVEGFTAGGGIMSVLFGAEPPELTLTDTDIIANSLSGSADLVREGGGLASLDSDSLEPIPVVMTRAVIEGNEPDQCVGC
jgi:hypothetical protein